MARRTPQPQGAAKAGRSGRDRRKSCEHVPNAVRRTKSLAAIRIAARKLFVSKGYFAASIDDIAQRCGLSKGAIYFYFTDKSEILRSLLLESQQRIYEPIFQRLSAGRESSALDRLALYINWVARMGAENPELCLLPILMSIELKDRSDSAHAVIKKIYKRVQSVLTRIVLNGQRSGLIHKVVPAKELAATVIAITDGALLEYLRRDGNLDGRKFVTGLRMTVLRGFGNPA